MDRISTIIKYCLLIAYIALPGSRIVAAWHDDVPGQTLDSLRRELLRIEDQIRTAKADERDVTSDIDAAERRVALLGQLIRDERRAVRLLDDSIAAISEHVKGDEATLAALGGRILELEDTQGQLSASLARSFLAERRLERWASLELILGAESWPQLLARRAVLQRFESTLRRSLKALSASVDTLQVTENTVFTASQSLRERRTVLEASRRQAADLENARQRDLRELSGSKRSLTARLDKLRNDQAVLSARRDQVRAAQAQVAEMIAALSRGEPLAGVPLLLLRGALPWPVVGKVVQKFGLTRNPHYSTVTDNPGIEVEADEESSVTSVADGNVSSVTWLRGFGNVCIVEHPGSYYTVYARLGQVLAQPGQSLAAGALIGYPGFDAASGKYRVHFELWSGKEKKDPLEWLQPR